MGLEGDRLVYLEERHQKREVLSVWREFCYEKMKRFLVKIIAHFDHEDVVSFLLTNLSLLKVWYV